MSPLILVGILVTISGTLADVKHVLEGSAHPPNEISPEAVNHLAGNNNGQFWWMDSNSPLKAAYDYYKKCNTKGNCLPSANPDAPAPHPFRPQENVNVDFNKKPEIKIDVNKNPFFNGNFKPNGGNANYNNGNPKIDIKKNPFLSGSIVTTGNGTPVIKDENGFLGVQPAQPFSKKPCDTAHPSDEKTTTHAVDGHKKKPGFATQHPTYQNAKNSPLNLLNVTVECKGEGFMCVEKSLCLNGVINTDGEGLLQIRSDVRYCREDTEICCRLNNLNEITAGKSSVPESTIKFAGGAGFSPGLIHVQPLNVQPDIVFAGEHGHHSTASTSKSIRDTSLSPNSVFPSTVDYSDTKFSSDVRFASTFQGPAYLPPIGPTTPQPKPFETRQPSINQQYVPSRPSTPSYVQPTITTPKPFPSTFRPAPAITFSPAPSTTFRPAPSTFRPAVSTTLGPAPSSPFRPAPSPFRPAPSTTFRPAPSVSYGPGPSTNREYLPPRSSTPRPTTSVTQYVPPQQPYQPSVTPRPYQPSVTPQKPYQPSITSQTPYQPSTPQQPYQPSVTPQRPYQPSVTPQRPYQPSVTPQQPYQPSVTPQRPYQPSVTPQQPYQPSVTPQRPYQPSVTPQQPYQPSVTPQRPYQPSVTPQQPFQPSVTPQKPYQPSVTPQQPYQPTFTPQRPYQPTPKPYQPPQTTPKPYQPSPTTPRPYQPQQTTLRPYSPPQQPYQPSTPRPTTSREYLPPRTPSPTVPQPFIPQQTTPRPTYPTPPRPTYPTPPRPSPSPYFPQPQPTQQYPSPSPPQPRPTSPPFRPSYPSPGTTQPRPTPPPYKPSYPSPGPTQPRPTPPPFKPSYPSPGPIQPRPTPPPFRPTPSIPQFPSSPQPSITNGYQYPTPSSPRPNPFIPQQSTPLVPGPSFTNPSYVSTSTQYNQPSTTSRPYQPTTQKPFVVQQTTSAPNPAGGYEYPKPTPTFGYPSTTPRQDFGNSNINNQFVRPPKRPSENPDQSGEAANIDGAFIRPTTARTQYQGELNTAPPSGCAAALKCVQEIYCTAEGVISPVPVVLTKEQELSRVPTTVCQDTEAGIIGKCCRDPNYKDPWPSANLVNGVDDGQYKEDDGIGQYQPDLQRNVRSHKDIPQQSFSDNQNANVQTVPQPTCGERHTNTTPQGRGPLDTNFAEIPWQAMILRDSNRSLLCGGVIIRRNAVLTAAHCVDGIETNDILIKGGEWKLGVEEEPLPFQVISVAARIRHPQYQRDSLNNDLALLILEEKLKLSKNVGPLCLPPPNQIPTENCIATGWGKRILQLHAKGAIMHSVNVKIMDNQQCQQTLNSRFQHASANYSPNTLCGYSNIDQCRVDYGSALACSVGNNYVLSGIYAWDTGCKQEGQIGGYIAPDVEWIESIVSKPLSELRKLDQRI